MNIANPRNISIQAKNYKGIYLCFDEEGNYSIRTSSEIDPYIIMHVDNFYKLARQIEYLPPFDKFMEREFGFTIE